MNALLETGISLVLVFLIFSIIAYVIQELVAVNLRYRGKMLWKSISQLFGNEIIEGRINLLKKLPVSSSQTQAFFQHPQIQSLQKDLKNLPSYIPAPNFALAIIDMVAKQSTANAADTWTNFVSGLKTLSGNPGNIYTVLKNLTDTSTDVKELQQKIESWFNDYMQRVSGWYESHITAYIRIIAVLLVLVFNLNVIRLSKTIYNDSQLRTSMVAMSERIVDNPATISSFLDKSFDKEMAHRDSLYKKSIDSITDINQLKMLQAENDSINAAIAGTYTRNRRTQVDSLLQGLNNTKLPLGWKSNSWQEDFQGSSGIDTFKNILLVLIGWFIAAGCISMGAPFWFDVLSKLINVRRAGTKPAADTEKK
jgi:thioredoxin-related protein